MLAVRANHLKMMRERIRRWKTRSASPTVKPGSKPQPKPEPKPTSCAGCMSGYKKIDPAENGGVKLIFNKYKKYVETTMKRTFTTFTAVSYKQQVVAGMNYEIIYKVKDTKGKEENIDVKVFQPLGESEP